MIGNRPPRACRAARRRLPLLYYRALDPGTARDVERHLAGCAACGGEWAELRRALDAVDAASVFPREREVDWTAFAARTVSRARLEASPAPRRRAWSWASLGIALGTAAIVAVVTIQLRPRPVPPPVDATGAGSLASLMQSAHLLEDRMARQGAARYLTDSRAVLVNLVGAASPCRRSDGQYDIALEKQRSRELLRRKNLYQEDLTSIEDQRLAALVRQLETVLVQVTSLDDCAPARQIHDLREQIETRQILLRIDLVTRDLQRGRTDVV